RVRVARWDDVQPQQLAVRGQVNSRHPRQQRRWVGVRDEQARKTASHGDGGGRKGARALPVEEVEWGGAYGSPVVPTTGWRNFAQDVQQRLSVDVEVVD